MNMPHSYLPLPRFISSGASEEIGTSAIASKADKKLEEWVDRYGRGGDRRGAQPEHPLRAIGE